MKPRVMVAAYDDNVARIRERSRNKIIRVFAIYQILLGWKAFIKYSRGIIMKPTNSPTQGQPNLRKNRLKVAIGSLFSTANILSWVGIGFYRKQTTRTCM